eukprot:scaffold103703_cov60-Phaeocystis_antarctica.AAC.5
MDTPSLLYDSDGVSHVRGHETDRQKKRANLRSTSCEQLALFSTHSALQSLAAGASPPPNYPSLYRRARAARAIHAARRGLTPPAPEPWARRRGASSRPRRSPTASRPRVCRSCAGTARCARSSAATRTASSATACRSRTSVR